MPPRKTASTRTTKTTKTSRAAKPATPTDRRHVIVGTGWLTLGILLALYMAFGAYLYLANPTGGFVEAVTGVFNYPAGYSRVPEYLVWLGLSLLATAAATLAFLGLVYRLITRGARRSQATLLGVFVVAMVGVLLLPPPSYNVVGYHAMQERVGALEHFQDKRAELAKAQGAQQPEASKTDLQVQAMQQLLLADILRQEAVRYDVEVKDSDVDAAYKQYVERNQGEDNLKKQLSDFLGWTTDQFREEIRVKLLEDKLNEKLSKDDEINKDRKEKAEGFLKQVRDEKKDFAEVAKQSDDPTAQTGGDLGFVKKGEIEDAIADKAFAMNVGDVSDVISTERGYVIIKLEDKNADQVKVRQILVRTKSLQEVLPDDIKGAQVNLLVKDLVWDENLATVQPKNQQPQTVPTGNPDAAPVPADPAVASPAAPAATQ